MVGLAMKFRTEIAILPKCFPIQRNLAKVELIIKLRVVIAMLLKLFPVRAAEILDSRRSRLGYPDMENIF